MTGSVVPDADMKDKGVDSLVPTANMAVGIEASAALPV
jgi:hypothetical protein